MRFVAALAVLVAAPAWTVTNLGALRGDSAAFEQGVLVNAAGSAVLISSEGSGTNHPRQQAFVWQNGKRTALAYRGAQFVEPTAIDDAGNVIGSAGKTGVLWRKGRPTALGAFAPEALADDGAIVIGDKGNGAVLWRNGTLSVLPGLGGAETQANAVDRGGTVVGVSSLPSGAQHAVVWRHGAPTDLGTLSGFDSDAYLISPDGTIAGFATVPGGGGEIRALEWKNGRLIDLGTFGAPAAQPVALNAQDDVLVETETTSQVTIGLWLLHDGKRIKIAVPGLGHQGLYAVGLDNEDDVVGWGIRTLRGFLWHDGHATLLPAGEQPRAVAGGWIVASKAEGGAVRLRLRG